MSVWIETMQLLADLERADGMQRDQANYWHARTLTVAVIALVQRLDVLFGETGGVIYTRHAAKP